MLVGAKKKKNKNVHSILSIVMFNEFALLYVDFYSKA